MESIFFVLSILAAVIGFFFFSEATMGVGIVAIGGCLGIWARLLQADRQHKQMAAWMEAVRKGQQPE